MCILPWRPPPRRLQKGARRKRNVRNFYFYLKKKKLLLKFGRCFNCIEKGHRNQDCSVTTECKLCKGQHSSCLCMAKPQQASGGIKIGLEITSARATCGY